MIPSGKEMLDNENGKAADRRHILQRKPNIVVQQGDLAFQSGHTLEG